MKWHPKALADEWQKPRLSASINSITCALSHSATWLLPALFSSGEMYIHDRSAVMASLYWSPHISSRIKISRYLNLLHEAWLLVPLSYSSGSFECAQGSHRPENWVGGCGYPEKNVNNWVKQPYSGGIIFLGWFLIISYCCSCSTINRNNWFIYIRFLLYSFLLPLSILFHSLCFICVETKV